MREEQRTEWRLQHTLHNTTNTTHLDERAKRVLVYSNLW